MFIVIAPAQILTPLGVKLFSDGLSDKGNVSAQSTLREAEEQEMLIYSVQFGAISPTPVSKVGSRSFNERLENAKEGQMSPKRIFISGTQCDSQRVTG